MWQKCCHDTNESYENGRNDSFQIREKLKELKIIFKR